MKRFIRLKISRERPNELQRSAIFAITLRWNKGTTNDQNTNMMAVASSATTALAVWMLVTINVSSTYTSFRKRLSLPTTTTNLEQFCETVWHVHHHQPPPHKAPFLEPGQECDAPFPNLSPAHAFHDAVDDDEGWSQDLMKNYRVVQQELQAYLSRTAESNNEHDDDDDWSTSSTSLCSDTSGFSKLTLLTSEGTPTRVGREYFSQTLEALLRNNVPLAPRPVCINGQGPQTGLAPHSDNINFLLTCHLGLNIPSGACCSMTMKESNEEIKYYWKEGELVICDTSFVHWTRNDSTSETRYVLSFAIWHPKLTHDEREGILQIHKALGQE